MDDLLSALAIGVLITLVREFFERRRMKRLEDRLKTAEARPAVSGLKARLRRRTLRRARERVEASRLRLEELELRRRARKIRKDEIESEREAHKTQRATRVQTAVRAAGRGTVNVFAGFGILVFMVIVLLVFTSAHHGVTPGR